jgi:hypothetical protein
LRRILVTSAFNVIFCGSSFLLFYVRRRHWQTTAPPPVEALPDGQDQ